MNGDNTERLPQESECRNETEGGILESASAVAQRVLEEIEALAGTTTCKPVQLGSKNGHRNKAAGTMTIVDLASSSIEVRRMRHICL